MMRCNRCYGTVNKLVMDTFGPLGMICEECMTIVDDQRYAAEHGLPS